MRRSVWFLLVLLMVTYGRHVYAEPVTVFLERQGIDEELLRLYQKVSSGSMQTKFILVRANDKVTDTLKNGRVFIDQYQPAIAPLLIKLNSTNKNAFVGNPQRLTLRAGSLLIVPDFQVRTIERLERVSSDKPMSLRELLSKKEARDFGISENWSSDVSFVEKLLRRNPNIDRANPSAWLVDSVTVPKQWVSLVIPDELQKEISSGRKQEVIKSTPLHWNSWIVPDNENGLDGDIKNAEVGDHLDAGRGYKFYIDLWTTTFTTKLTESSGTDKTRSFADALQDAETQRNKQLTVLVIPHSNALACKPQEVPLEFNFHGLDSLVKLGWTIPSNLIKKQLMDDKVALLEKRYSLARTSFWCKVRNDAENEKARISLIVFDGDYPVEDFSIAWSVGTANTNLPRSVTRPRGASLLESMLHAKSDSPELSLSILDSAVGREDSGAPTVGVLRGTSTTTLCNNERFCVWFSPNRQEYIINLNKNLAVLGGKQNSRSIAEYSRLLPQLIIQQPNDDKIDKAPAREAREALNRFITTNLKERIRALSNPKSVPPLIVVRAVPRSGSTDVGTVEFVFPIGMIPVEQGGDIWFIGQLFRTVALLPYQRHDQKDACQNQWAVAFPRDDNGDEAMKAAIAAFVNKNKWLSNPILRDPLPLLKTFLTGNRSLEKMTLPILAHHSGGDISFKDTDHVFSHLEIDVKFAPDSIVMLNGCGTAVPTESQVLRKIINAGAGAAIATTSSVHGGLAGSYFDCFQRELSASKENKSLSLVHYNALRCIYKTKSMNTTNTFDLHWMAHAFKYVLMGNGNLQVCDPIGRNEDQ